MSRIEESYLIDLEFSGDLKSSPSGDLALVTGMNNLKQALFNRLVTVPGSLAHRPDYGVGIQLYQNGISSFSKQQELALKIRKQFEQDHRVAKVLSVRITKDGEGKFYIYYKVEAVGIGSFEDTKPFGDYEI